MPQIINIKEEEIPFYLDEIKKLEEKRKELKLTTLSMASIWEYTNPIPNIISVHPEIIMINATGKGSGPKIKRTIKTFDGNVTKKWDKNYTLSFMSTDLKRYKTKVTYPVSFYLKYEIEFINGEKS